METLEYISKIIRHYVPEWAHDRENPDLGAAFAEAFSYVMDANRLLYSKMFDKHYYAFLSYMGAEPPPPRAATGFAVFKPASGSPRGELVPAGSVLYNDELPYSTEESVFVTPSVLTCAFFVNGDVINRALSSSSLTLFDSSAENLQKHELRINHDWAFGDLGEDCIISLDFDTEFPTAPVWLYQGDSSSRFSIVTDDKPSPRPQPPFPLPVPGPPPPSPPPPTDVSPLRLKSPGFTGGNFIASKLTSKYAGLCIKKASISITSGPKLSARYFHQDAETDSEAIYPFGTALVQNDCFYISCNEAFSKKGARVTAELELSFDIIKPLGDLPKMIGLADPIQITRCAFEYWNGGDYAPLPGAVLEVPDNPPSEQTRIFSFICPDDMSLFTLAGLESRWIRVRLLEISNVYMSLTYLVPVITVKKIRYFCSGLKPSSVTLINNLQTDTIFDVTEPAEILKPLPSSGPSIYLGFSKPFGTQLLSLLIDPKENSHPEIEKISFYIYTGDGWTAAQTTDTTENLTAPGLIKVFMPELPSESSLFGCGGLYWLRADFEKRRNAEFVSKTELNLYMNAAALVQKTAWQRELLTISDNSEALRLKEKNITDLKIYAGEDELKKYKLDAGEGVITPDPTELKSYGTPVEISVEYRATRGFGGNCEADTITRMADSLGFVQYVTNPLPINDGWSYDTSEQIISVGTKKLRHRGRAVTAGDFEALAYEFAGGLLRCRCQIAKAEKTKPGFLNLTYLPHGYPRRYSGNLRPMTTFSNQLEAYLLKHCHPLLSSSGRLVVNEAEYRPLSVSATLGISDDKDWQKVLAETQAALDAFLDPMTGNFNKTGFDFNEYPDTELLQRFLYSLPAIESVTQLTIGTGNPPDGLCVYIPGIHILKRSGEVTAVAADTEA